MARFFNKSVSTYNKFKFHTRFYDPQVEKLNEMKKDAEMQSVVLPNGSVNKEMMRRRMAQVNERNRPEIMEKKRLQRLFLLLALLAVGVYFFLTYVNKVDSGVTYIYDNAKPSSVK
jgi:hypothetical protein